MSLREAGVAGGEGEGSALTSCDRVSVAVLPGHGERRADAPPRADPPHRSLPVGGGAELRGGAGDGEVQVGSEELLQEQRRALHPV